MDDQYGRRIQCPKCDSLVVIAVHEAFSSSIWLKCSHCGFKEREEMFRAIPVVGSREEDKKKDEWNPSRRYHV